MNEIASVKLRRITTRYIILIFLIQIATSMDVKGQSLSINGVISTPTSAVRNASVTFVDNSDPTLKYTAITDSAGRYRIDGITAIKPAVNQPTNFEVAQNYPDPFSSRTAISYELNKPSDVRVTIYDVLGRKVRTFDVGAQNAGIHGIIWNGRDNVGRRVAPGVYFYRLVAGGKALVKKMIYGFGPAGASLSIPGISSFPVNNSEKRVNAPLLVKTFTVRIADTDSTMPFISDQQFNDVEIHGDTAVNFTVAGGKAIVQDSVIYTFSVLKDSLGVQDTLNAVLSVYNQSTTKKTFEVGASSYNWSLTDSTGKVLLYGPNPVSLVLVDIGVNPGQSTDLYDVDVPYFGAIFKPGSYVLNFSLLPGTVNFHSSVWADKDGQVADTSGIITPIYPLKIGNSWTFARSYYANDGSLLGTDTTTESIISEFLINGEKWFLRSSTVTGYQLITARKDGIYTYFPDLDTAVILYKYPATAGDSYNSGYELWDGSTNKLFVTPLPMTVDSTNEVLSVPDGKFTCYKYTQHGISVTVGGVTDEIPGQEVFLSSVGPTKELEGGIVSELISTNF